MKTVTVKYSGWHARPAAELAQMQARLKEIAKQRDALWKEQQRLWADSSELRYEQGKLSRWVRTQTREPQEFQVFFNGIAPPTMEDTVGMSPRACQRIIKLAKEQFSSTP